MSWTDLLFFRSLFIIQAYPSFTYSLSPSPSCLLCLAFLFFLAELRVVLPSVCDVSWMQLCLCLCVCVRECVCVLEAGWPGWAGNGAQMEKKGDRMKTKIKNQMKRWNQKDTEVMQGDAGVCVCVCVFMLQQYEPQLCDLLTFSKTTSVLKDGQLKEKTQWHTAVVRGLLNVYVTTGLDLFICCCLHRYR